MSSAGLEAKIKTLLRQREEVIEALRDASLTLSDVGVDHTEFPRAFLNETPPRDEDAEQEAAAIEKRRAQLLEGIEELGRSVELVEALEEEWPLKRSWLQVLFQKMRNVYVSRDSRAIQRIVEDAMRDNLRATVSKHWVLAWLRSNFPVTAIKTDLQVEAANSRNAGADGGREDSEETPVAASPSSGNDREDDPSTMVNSEDGSADAAQAASTSRTTRADEGAARDEKEVSAPCGSPSEPKLLATRIDYECSLQDVKWPLWKLWPLRFKIHALAYLRLHRDWFWRVVAPEEQPRQARLRVKLGKWQRVNVAEARVYAVRTVADGGPTLLREVGARAVAPKPSACVSVDLRLPREVSCPSTADCDSVEGEQEDEDPPQPLDATELRDVLREAVDIVLDPELQQIPGYIVTKVGFTDKSKEVLRVTSFFSTEIDKDFWVQSLSGTLKIWPGLGELQNWIVQRDLSIAGADVQLACEYRAPRAEVVTNSDVTLRFPSLLGVSNPLHAFFRSCMESTARAVSRADAVCGMLLEAVAAGSVEDVLCVRICSGPRAVILEKSA